MVNVVISYNLHQPIRLHPDRDIFVWDEKNEEVFRKISKENYIPTLDMIIAAVEKYPQFKISLGMSGTFLEQAEKYVPQVIDALRTLFNNGQKNGQVEFLDEPYYNSLTGLFSDLSKTEFREQVSLQRTKLRELFNESPTSFRHTRRRYNNDIASVVADMGFKVMLTDIINGNGHHAYKAEGSNIIVLPRARELSHAIYRGKQHSPEEYAKLVSLIDGDIATLGYSIERTGNERLRNFWPEFIKALCQDNTITMATPKEVTELMKDKELPPLSIPGYSTKTWKNWKDVKRDTRGLIESDAEFKIFQDIEGLEKSIREVGGDMIKRWRLLTQYDLLGFTHSRGDVPRCHANPYESTADAAHILTRKVDGFSYDLQHRFNIIRKSYKPTILMVSAEPGQASEGLGPLANYVNAQIGGVGIVLSSIIPALMDSGFEVHLATLNLKKRFQIESGLNEKEWNALRYSTDTQNIHLVNSHVFENYMSSYEGDQARTAAIFQEQVANYVLKEVMAQAKGKFILHLHDAMAGGLIAAKAKARGIPTIGSIHSSHTIDIPLNYFDELSNEVRDRLYLSNNFNCVDSLSTMAKNCGRLIMVANQWLLEHVKGYFPDVISANARREIIIKHNYGCIDVAMNGMPSSVYPENIEYFKNPDKYYKEHAAKLIRPFGPDSNLVEVKRDFRVAFQRETKLNEDPNAIILLYCARADRYQKSIHWVEEKAQALVDFYKNRGVHLQIGLIANGVGKEHERKAEEDILGRIAYASKGDICYYNHTKELDALGNAATEQGFGPSRFEPCGQNDMRAFLYGALFVGTNTGGYHDKIENLRLKIDGATRDHGNGFTFDYHPDEFWKAMIKGVDTILKLRDTPSYYEANLKRIMVEARKNFGIDNMTAAHIQAYERLIGAPIF